MGSAPTLAPDAAIVLGIAATAIPFARTPEDEAERWLRVLRLHGEVGSVLQSLGVSEAPLEGPSPHEDEDPGSQAGGDVVARVGDAAAVAAERRQADCFTTIDVLVAVIDVYGSDFNNVLRSHGTDRQEVLERLYPQAA